MKCVSALLVLVALLALSSAQLTSPALESLFAAKETQLRAFAQATLTAYAQRGTKSCNCSYFDCHTTEADFDTCSFDHGYSECSAGRYYIII